MIDILMLRVLHHDELFRRLNLIVSRLHTRNRARRINQSARHQSRRFDTAGEVDRVVITAGLAHFVGVFAFAAIPPLR